MIMIISSHYEIISYVLNLADIAHRIADVAGRNARL